MASPGGDAMDLINILESMLITLEGEKSSSSQGDEEKTMTSPCGDERDLVISDDDDDDDDDDNIRSMLSSLFPQETPKKDKCASTGFTFDAIKEHICKCAKRHKRTKADMLRDIFGMVAIGLKHGNIKRDKLQRIVPRGAARIRELAYWYEIPIKSSARERIRLQSDTLTFARAVSCFPHLASMLLHEKVGLARNGAQSVLASEQLPDAMKHSGFGGLIPKGCDPYLMKAYLFAHTAYMVDFSRLINPGDGRSLKALASSQLEYSKIGVEKSRFPDESRAGFLRAVGLTDAGVFKNIVDVCNNLCKKVGKPELAYETAEKYHIKNGMICFFEDDSKGVDDGDLAKMMADNLSVDDSSTSTDCDDCKGVADGDLAKMMADNLSVDDSSTSTDCGEHA